MFQLSSSSLTDILKNTLLDISSTFCTQLANHFLVTLSSFSARDITILLFALQEYFPDHTFLVKSEPRTFFIHISPCSTLYFYD